MMIHVEKLMFENERWLMKITASVCETTNRKEARIFFFFFFWEAGVLSPVEIPG